MALCGGRTPDEADAFSSIDLIHFLTLLADLSDNSEIDQATQNLADAASGVCVKWAVNFSGDAAR